MFGQYRIYKNGELVVVTNNLITTAGKKIILRYLAGETGSWGGAIAVGSNSTAASASDTKLKSEFGRGSVSLVASDVVNSRLTFKAELSMDVVGYIYEIGLYPFIVNSSAEYDSKMLISFDTNLDEIVGGVTDSTNYRVGTSSYSVTADASSTATATVSSLGLDFSGYSNNDVFSLSYFINSNISQISIRLKTDSTNYYSANVNPTNVAGYYTKDIAKSVFVATGSPDWSSISSLDFIITANSSGSATVQLDAFRVDDEDTYVDYGLVSRAIVAGGKFKGPNDQLDIEYSVSFSL